MFDLLWHGRGVKPEAHLIAFDLLEVEGRELIGKAIELRKADLTRLVRGDGAGLQICEHVDRPGDIVFEHACKLGCEGIVSKRRGSRYRSGRSPDWVKTKNPSSAAARRLVEEDWIR